MIGLELDLKLVRDLDWTWTGLGLDLEVLRDLEMVMKREFDHKRLITGDGVDLNFKQNETCGGYQ